MAMRNMLLTITGLVVMVPGAASAIDYVPSPPISQIVTDGPRDCQVSGRVTMPVIAWGADMVTIHANGDAETTQSGSLFDQAGLNFEIKREDDVTKQLRAVLRCDTPYFRGTVGMVSMVAPVTQADPRTELVVIYQHSWSAGGDALVAKRGIKRPEDLRGKTIAIQRYGPHVGYLAKLLADAGIALSDVNIKWTEQLTAHPSSSAMLA